MNVPAYEQLTLFPAASPASRSPSPGSDEAREMTVTSGLKCCELLRSSGPAGCLVKMLLASSIWRSTRCFLTWKPSATPGGAVVVPAAAIDAPHRRDRCAILAHADGGSTDVADAQRVGLRKDGHQPSPDAERDHSAHREERGPKLRKAGCCGCDVSDPDGIRSGPGRQRIPARGAALRHPGGERTAQSGLGGVADGISPWLDRGMSEPGFWMEEPDTPRITQRKKNRINRLKCLGNAVVPQQFYPMFRYIREIEEGMT